LFIFALHAAAYQSSCENCGNHLNELASADQQIRQEWYSLEQDPTTTVTQRNALQQRWRIFDSENLKQFKEIIAACGWPKTNKDSYCEQTDPSSSRAK
jgi:hypothetical protein